MLLVGLLASVAMFRVLLTLPCVKKENNANHRHREFDQTCASCDLRIHIFIALYISMIPTTK